MSPKEYYSPDFALRMKVVDATDLLMLKKPLDKLTVIEICDEANISRPTFYRHFKDKYDIAQWYWSYFASQSLKETGISITWFESNYYMLKAFESRADFFLNSFESEHYNGCRAYGYRQRVHYLQTAAAEKLGQEMSEELNYQIKFFVDAESRAVVNWLIEGRPVSAEKIARLIEGCVPPKLRDLLDCAHDKNPSSV